MRHTKSLNVWVHGKRVGTLRELPGTGKFKLAYIKGTPDSYAVSLTLLPSNGPFVFDSKLPYAITQSIPQGHARGTIESVYKNVKGFNGLTDMDFLMLTGRNQIGRVSFTPINQDVLIHPHSVTVNKKDIEDSTDSSMLFHRLQRMGSSKPGDMDGVAGNVPKVLARVIELSRSVTDITPEEEDVQIKSPTTLITSDSIVKSAPGQIPELVTNEFTCLEIARRAGLNTAGAIMSKDNGLIVVERFDRLNNGKFGFDDFSAMVCVDGYNDKSGYFSGSYREIMDSLGSLKDTGFKFDIDEIRLGLFKRMMISNIVRDNDLHLKNMALIYDNRKIKLSPVYDITCSSVIYLPMAELPDSMALPWEPRGNNEWLDRNGMIKFGVASGIPKSVCESSVDHMVSGVREWLSSVNQDDHPTKVQISRVVSRSLQSMHPEATDMLPAM